MIKIKSEEQFDNLQKGNDEPIILFMTTPMCGTCQLARNFLLVLEKVDNVPPIYEVDVNYFKSYANSWEIESVPCLLYILGNSITKLYAFESVTKIYQFIQDSAKG
ncbi:thioredoxin family protein [Evansella sp. AB-rgal1]|uniref:thioredoxin family protein n=1 Tax=Evansella sp. AB-rgal1 TaxID=3242696 RepID=UPI00359DB73A